MNPQETAYNINQLVSDIDWDDFPSVVEAFRLRINGWYFDQLAEWPKTGHEAFPVLMIMYGLLNTFSYYFGVNKFILLEEICAVDADTSRMIIRRLLDPVMETSGFYGGGICGLGGKLYVVDDDLESITLDPWVFRDKMQDWFNMTCAHLTSPTIGWGKKFYDRVGVERYKSLIAASDTSN